ncbi:hypothetical protein ACFX2J_000290 [Malus domestica]
MHLPDVIWAYRTSLKNIIGFSPYSLAYGSEVISPMEMLMLTTRVSPFNDVEWDAVAYVRWRWKDLELLKEKKAKAVRKVALYYQQVSRAYNRTVKPRNFKEGDLVLKTAERIKRLISEPSKFTPQ